MNTASPLLAAKLDPDSVENFDFPKLKHKIDEESKKSD
jgi:hypothetical protein